MAYQKSAPGQQADGGAEGARQSAHAQVTRTLSESASAIPLELRALAQWVCASADKLPLSPRTGQVASVTDPSSWGTFEEALSHATAHDLRIGFVLTQSDPYTIIDLDDKAEAPATEEQRERFASMIRNFDTYTEQSTSGRGFHIVCKGRIPSGTRHDGVEVYSDSRYMIFTGDRLHGAPETIAERQAMLDTMVGLMNKLRATDVDLVETEGLMTDAQVVEMAQRAANGEKFDSLCKGEWQDMGYPSQSEADFALLNVLAFYSPSNAQVRRLFRYSALGKRDKALRDRYLDDMLRKIRSEQATGTAQAARLERTFTPTAAAADHGPARPARGQVELLPAAEVHCTPIRWLWPGFLARGKLHILAGPPGTGKTTIALALAAAVSGGLRWPSGSLGPSGNVLVWSGEDDAADTLVPRLTAAGANLSRVFLIGDTREQSGEPRPFDPARDMGALLTAAKQIGDVSMLIADPVVNAVTGDSHKNTEVRRALQPLVDLGARLDCAVLGVSHFAKGTTGRDPTERVVGSIAFGALPRVVMVAVKRAEDGDGHQRILARAKSNIGPDGGGFAYDLEQTKLPNGIDASRVKWGAPLDGSARELIGDLESTGDDETSLLDEVTVWLAQALSNGDAKVAELKREASNAGYSWRMVQSAKTELKAEASRVSEGNEGAGHWVWRRTP